jgi:hypothetical protein
MDPGPPSPVAALDFGVPLDLLNPLSADPTVHRFLRVQSQVDCQKAAFGLREQSHCDDSSASSY